MGRIGLTDRRCRDCRWSWETTRSLRSSITTEHQQPCIRALATRVLPPLFHRDGAELGGVNVYFTAYYALLFLHLPSQMGRYNNRLRN